MLDITLVLSLAIAVHSNIKMEHVGTLPETNDILSPRIKPLFGKLSPPAEKEECNFCLLQDNFWCSNYRAADTTLTQNVSRPGHRYLIKNKPCAAPIVEQHINTNTHASFACKNTPKKLNCTMCCHKKVHTECTTDLTTLLSLLTYDHSLECGQLTGCNRHWVDVW